MTIETITRRRRSAALAAAVREVINSDLPSETDTDAVIARFGEAADQFIESMERGLPVLRQALEKELADLERNIKIAGAGKPPSFSINSQGFRLPDDEPPPAPLPDSRFSLPTDEPPLIPDNQPFTPPDGDDE